MAHISPFHTLDQRLSPLQICTATVYEIFRLASPFGKAQRATYKPLDPCPQIDGFVFDALSSAGGDR